MVIPYKMFLKCSVLQGKDSPKDKNKTLHRKMQGLIFLWRRLSVIAHDRINHIALRHSILDLAHLL